MIPNLCFEYAIGDEVRIPLNYQDRSLSYSELTSYLKLVRKLRAFAQLNELNGKSPGAHLNS